MTINDNVQKSREQDKSAIEGMISKNPGKRLEEFEEEEFIKDVNIKTGSIREYPYTELIKPEFGGIKAKEISYKYTRPFENTIKHKFINNESLTESETVSLLLDFLDKMSDLIKKVTTNTCKIDELTDLVKRQLDGSLEEEEETVIVLPADKESSRKILNYMHENQIEYEIIGGAVVLFESSAQEVKNYFKDIPINQKDIISSEEMDYKEVQSLRKNGR